MRRWKIILMIALCLVAIAAMIVFPGREPEPVHNGKTLSEWHLLWQQQLRRDDEESRRITAEATNAIHEIGTNALPLLLDWMSYRRSTAVRIISPRIPGLRDLDRTAQKKTNDDSTKAMEIFRILGPLARPAIPDLTRLLSTNSVRIRSSAACALAAIGDEAFPTLLAALKDPQHPGRLHAALWVGAFRPSRFGTNVIAAVDPLIECSASTNAELAQYAVKSLAILRLKPEVTIPAAKRAYQSSDPSVRREAVLAFGAFGEEESLRLASADPEPKVQFLANKILADRARENSLGRTRQ